MSKEHIEVLIVGAGLSGIGAACHLQAKSPQTSFAILEGRDNLGGTWDLFRYPGIRSDSDMHTFGYEFKPWRSSKALADGPAILHYLQETADENDLNRHIRYGHQVQQATWCSEEATWTVEVKLKETGRTVTLSCNFLLICAGYYRYDQGYSPDFKGRGRFQGQIIHPQAWPEGLDYAGKRVVVIGSGATAMTIVPAMAETAGHVVMLQRSPTYVWAMPATDKIDRRLRSVLPDHLAYQLTRWKNIVRQQVLYQQARRHPALIKRILLWLLRRELGPDYDLATHFTPEYDVWDQRICVIADGDLYAALRSGRASVVTDQIDTFTERGICLQSGQQLAADIIVTATGLNMIPLGGVCLVVDGQAVDLAESYLYRGLMYSDVPNLASIFGYINASWTLRADLMADYVCRLLNHMAEGGFQQCTPRLRAEEQGMPARPWIDDFSPGYLQRAISLLAKQGDSEPWLNRQDYDYDKKILRPRSLEDGVLVFR